MMKISSILWDLLYTQPFLWNPNDLSGSSPNNLATDKKPLCTILVYHPISGDLIF